MDAVTTCAVCNNVGANLGGEAVITVEVAAGALSGNSELLGELHSLMTFCACCPGQRLGCNRGCRVDVRLDHVNSVAVGAHRGLRIAATDGLAVNALDKVGSDGGVALATGPRDVELEYGRLGIGRRPNVMHAMTLSAYRGLRVSRSDRAAVDALPYDRKGRALSPLASMTNL